MGIVDDSDEKAVNLMSFDSPTVSSSEKQSAAGFDLQLDSSTTATGEFRTIPHGDTIKILKEFHHYCIL